MRFRPGKERLLHSRKMAHSHAFLEPRCDVFGCAKMPPRRSTCRFVATCSSSKPLEAPKSICTLAGERVGSGLRVDGHHPPDLYLSCKRSHEPRRNGLCATTMLIYPVVLTSPWYSAGGSVLLTVRGPPYLTRRPPSNEAGGDEAARGASPAGREEISAWAPRHGLDGRWLCRVGARDAAVRPVTVGRKQEQHDRLGERCRP